MAVRSRGWSFCDRSNQHLIRPRANFPGILPPLSAAGNSRQERRQGGRKEDVSLPPGVHVRPGPGSLTRSSLALTQQRRQPSALFSPTGSLPVPPPFLGEQRIKAPAEVARGLCPPLGLGETQHPAGCIPVLGSYSRRLLSTDGSACGRPGFSHRRLPAWL